MSENKSTKPTGLYYVAMVLAFFALVTVVTQFLIVTHQAIDIAFPTNLNEIDIDSDFSSMRWSISMLVVLFPIYLALSVFISRGVTKWVNIRESTLRKVAIYLAVISTTVTFIGTLVTALYYYLGGEFGISFALKSATVLLTAALVGLYYAHAMGEFKNLPLSLPKILAFCSSALVLVSVVWSVSVMGSPSEMRARANDRIRVENLSSIQNELVNYWTTNHILPEDLLSLESSTGWFSLPSDPITAKAYKYKIITQSVEQKSSSTIRNFSLTDAKFELCATFQASRSTPTENDISSNGSEYKMLIAQSGEYPFSGGIMGTKWNHEQGEHCYTRIISEKNSPPMFR